MFGTAMVGCYPSAPSTSLSSISSSSSSSSSSPSSSSPSGSGELRCLGQPWSDAFLSSPPPLHSSFSSGFDDDNDHDYGDDGDCDGDDDEKPSF